MTLESLLADIGADVVFRDDNRCEARWRGASIRVGRAAEERLQQIKEAVSALQDLPDPLSMAEVDLRRTSAAGQVQQFVPAVSRAQATHLRVLSGDAAYTFVDTDTGTFTILSTDGFGDEFAIEHILPKASIGGTPARSAAAVAACAEEISVDARWEKLQRLLPHLTCVRCASGAGLELVDELLRCVQCAETYEVREGVPILLRDPDEFKDVDPTDGSSNGYSRQVLSFIPQFNDQWVLDCGCGQPVDNVPNVVHLEIAPFKNVDIVASSEELPFAEGTFAAVASESVLEHVCNPWKAVEELHRVLKADGLIRVDAPLLAPFHAFPNHFHNFTQSGLDQLLGKFEKLDGGVNPHQEPWVAIGWILRLAREGLPDQALVAEFDATTLGGLLTGIASGAPSKVIHPLNDATRIALAAGFFFYGRKI
jgi:SAM-dependent methyltransferase